MTSTSRAISKLWPRLDTGSFVRWKCRGTDGGDGNEPADISAETSGRHRRKYRTSGERFRGRWLVAAAVLAVGIVSIIWNLRRPLPPLRITRYTKITHDGRDKWPVGTDGSRLYLYQHSLYTIGQVGIAGGEIVQIPVLASADVLEGEYSDYLSDVSPDGSSFLISKKGARRSMELPHTGRSASPPR